MTRITIALAALCCLSCSGAPGSIKFTWFFDGAGCATVPDVATVSVQIPGVAIPNDGRAACETNGVPGLQVDALAHGSYSYVVTAERADGGALYRTLGSVTVDGPTAAAVTLLPVDGATGRHHVSWSVPDGGCDEATAMPTNTLVSVDSMPTKDTDCRSGATGVDVEVPAGMHTVVVSSFGRQYGVVLQGSGSINVRAGSVSSKQYALAWNAGGAPLQWRFAGGLDCAQAGVDKLAITIANPGGQYDFADVPCTQDGHQGFVVTIPTGEWSAWGRATARDGGTWASPQTFPYPFDGGLSPARVTSVAGVFPRWDAGCPSITLLPQ